MNNQKKNYSSSDDEEKESMQPKKIRENPTPKKFDEDLSNGIIHLNVGGTRFTTTKETLLSDRKSMLYAMFRGTYDSKRDSNGAYFIDRDGEYFRYILNYLRNGTLDKITDEEKAYGILREAQFFQIEGLITEAEKFIESIKDQSDSKRSRRGQYAITYLGGYGKSPQVYTKETGGGFSQTCVTLNRLAQEGYHVEGVASSAEGHYYAILRSNDDSSDLFNQEIKQKQFL